MTLIEVLAAVALAGTLLAGITLAKARLTRQWAVAERKHAAVDAADELLTLWWQEPDSLPREGSGHVSAALAEHSDDAIARLEWTTSVVENRAADDADIEFVRLIIRNTDWSQETNMPLVDVVVILPRHPVEADHVQ